MSPPSAQAGPTTGDQVGPYALEDQLGEGGMARVFIARRAGAESVCVLKLLHVGLEKSTVAAKRFQREAHIASMLDHPHIAPVLDAGWAGPRFYIAMPFISGVTVETLLEAARARQAVLPFEVTLPLAMQALDALSYAHRRTDDGGAPLGLVHRDLSPRNLMVDFDGRLQIIDFGVAKGRVDSFETASGVAMGTPFYMAPEQAEAGTMDARADLYTLAAVLFEMLTGTRVAHGNSRVSIMLSVVRDIAPRASAVNPHVPAAFDPVFERALAKDAEDRFQDAASFARALRAAAGPLCETDRASMRGFLQSLLPEARAEAESLSRPVMPQALAAKDQSLATRTAVGPVAPRDPDLSDAAMPTRTAIAGDREARRGMAPLARAAVVLGALLLGGLSELAVPGASPVGPAPALEARVRALTASPERQEALALVADLRRLAEALPQAERGRVGAHLDRAERAKDPGQMAQALDQALAAWPR